MSLPAKLPLQATSRPRKRRKLDVEDSATQTSPSLLERYNVSDPCNTIANFGRSSWRAALLEGQADLKSRDPEEAVGHPDSNDRNATKTATQGRDKPASPRSRTPPSHSQDLLDALSTRTHTSPDNDLPSPSIAAETRLRNTQAARISRPAKHALHARAGAAQPKAILGIPHGQKLSEKTTHTGPTSERAGTQEHVGAGPSGRNNEAGNTHTSLNTQKRARKDSPVSLEAFRNGIHTGASDAGLSTTSNGSHGKTRAIMDSCAASSVASNRNGKSQPALAGPSGSNSNRSSDPMKSIPLKRIQMHPRAVSTAFAQPVFPTQATGNATNPKANLLSSSQRNSSPLPSSLNPSSSRRRARPLWTSEEEHTLIECHDRRMAYAEMRRYFPGRSLKSLQNKVARLKAESTDPNTLVELSSEAHPPFRLRDSISQRQTQLPFLPDKGKGRADGKPRMDARVGFDSGKSSERRTRTQRHPDVIITVNTRLSQQFLAESIRGAMNEDEEDPIEDDDRHGHVNANANQGLVEIEDEIPLEDMIEAEKEMSSSRPLEATEEVDRMTQERPGSTIDNAVSVSSDSTSFNIYAMPSSPPGEADREAILNANHEMECMQPWDPAAEELGSYDHDSEDESREEAWWRAVAANVEGVSVPAEFDRPHPSNRRTSRSPVVEFQTVDIASHSELENESDSEESNIFSESTNHSPSGMSSSSEVSNDTPRGASDNSSQSDRPISDSTNTNGHTQSTPPARSSRKDIDAHESPVNPFLNAWPNMSKRPHNWHSGMTDSESESSSSSSDSNSDSENAPAKKTPTPVLKQSSMPAVRHFEANRNKGETVGGGGECATHADSIVHGVFHESTEERKAQGRRARRRRSKDWYTKRSTC